MIISASYSNSSNDAVSVQTDNLGAVAIQLVGNDNSGGLREEYLAWAQSNQTASYVAPAVDTLAAAEAHVAAHFSTPRLLQMKVWYDTFPHEDCPKLDAVYTWANAVTIQAAQGNTNFQEPPHTFEELVAEAMSILGAGQ